MTVPDIPANVIFQQFLIFIITNIKTAASLTPYCYKTELLHTIQKRLSIFVAFNAIPYSVIPSPCGSVCLAWLS